MHYPLRFSFEAAHKRSFRANAYLFGEEAKPAEFMDWLAGEGFDIAGQTYATGGRHIYPYGGKSRVCWRVRTTERWTMTGERKRCRPHVRFTRITNLNGILARDDAVRALADGWRMRTHWTTGRHARPCTSAPLCAIGLMW